MISFIILYFIIGAIVSAIGQWLLFLAFGKTSFTGWLIDAVFWPLTLVQLIRIIL